MTVSRHNVEHLLQRLPGSAIRYIANGVPTEPETADKPCGTILCVARLVPKKGIDTLIRAAAQIRAELPHSRIEIAGGGPELAALQELAEELGVADAVTFLGPLTAPDVAAAYERATVVAAPCRVDASGDRDGLPTVLLEAMARGIAVVSTNVVGIPELVHDNESGLLVPPDDPGALASAIIAVVRDRSLRTRLAAAGRQVVAAEYNPANSVSALLKLHHGLNARSTS